MGCIGHVGRGKHSLTAALALLAQSSLIMPPVADTRYPAQDYDGPIATSAELTPRQARQLAKKLERKRQKKLRKTTPPAGDS